MDCLFCKITSGEIPSYKIYEDNIVVAFLDINPTSKGHTLIIPKKHYQDLYDIEESVLNHIQKVSKTLSNHITDKLNCDGITFVQNNGIAQEVKHYHLHIIPKYKDNKKDSNLEEICNILKD